jgi:hypothetical protein
VWGTVANVDRDDGDCQHLLVTLDDGSQGRAVAYPPLAGRCMAADEVLLNTTAVELDLGTGGYHFVVARRGEGVGLDAPSGGHVMKLRYTPLQVDVVSVESPESPHHDVMSDATSLESVPVVCCGLHSQVPLVAAAVKRTDPALRVAYCMSDGAALPMALSSVVRSSVATGLLDVTVSCGQSFGGQLEAVNLHSGMLAARHVADANVIVVAIGPGVVGTATPFGHGGVAQGEAINAASALGGSPVACLRVSFADARERHRGVSHHTIAALSRVALARATVALPTLSADLSDAIDEELSAAGVWDLHERAQSAEGSIAAPPLRGVEVVSMGRGQSDDPAFFAAAFAAGDIASRIALGRPK